MTGTRVPSIPVPGLAAVRGQSSVVTQGPGALHPPRQWSHDALEWSWAQPVQCSCKSRQTSATTKLDPGRVSAAELRLAAAATTLTLGLHPGPR